MKVSIPNIPCPDCEVVMNNYQFTMNGYNTGVFFRECPKCQLKINICDIEFTGVQMQ